MRRRHWMLSPLLLFPLVLCCRTSEPATRPAESIEVYFSPGGGCTDAVVRELGRAKSSIYIQAYMFTSAPIAKAVIDARKRNVKVEAILDKSNRTDKYSAAEFLKNQGCNVLIDARHAIAHNKIMIIDENVVLTGSFNFTKNAEESNAENLLVIRGQATLAEKYLLNFRLHQQHSEPCQGLVGSGVVEQKSENTPKVKYVGSKNGDLYHYPSCSTVKRISKDNLVQYDSAPPGKRLHDRCPQ